jgi:hypothetical protein
MLTGFCTFSAACTATCPVRTDADPACTGTTSAQLTSVIAKSRHAPMIPFLFMMLTNLPGFWQNFVQSGGS